LSPCDFRRIEAQIAAPWQYVAMRAGAGDAGNCNVEMAGKTSRVPTQAYRAFAGAGTPKRGLDASKLRYSGANPAAT